VKATITSPKPSTALTIGTYVFPFPSPHLNLILTPQCYWSLQDGNETSTWSDALLTSSGIAQAEKANTFWRSQISSQKIPTPESYYTSPLLRCLATANITFSGLELPEDRPFVPTIKELFREALGVHTCDRRSSKSVIAEQYPDWPFEKGFAEDDPLWDKDHRETNEAMDIRLREALDDVFSSDENTYISISSHSGAIGSILRGMYCGQRR